RRRVRQGHRRPPARLAHAAEAVARPAGSGLKGRGRRAVRIGIVSPYSFDVPGGVQNHIVDLAEALIGLGHEVSVLAPADEDADLPASWVPAGGRLPFPYNGRVARIAFGPVSPAGVRRWLARGKFDVLHVHEPMV